MIDLSVPPIVIAIEAHSILVASRELGSFERAIYEDRRSSSPRTAAFRAFKGDE